MSFTAPERRRQGERIRRARQRARFTLQELSERITRNGDSTVSPQAINKWEHGLSSPTLNTSIALARALDVKWSDLFCGDEAGAA